MFAAEQPKLSRLGRSGPDGFERICTFVLLTIRVPLYSAATDYKLLRKGDLLERCEYAFETCDDIEAENLIVDALCDIPSIGPAKAGFICQMIYGLSGCIDTHNLTRFELAEREFRLNKKGSPRLRAKLIRRYNEFCRRAGGSQALWDGWCEYVAANQPVTYSSAERVSALHLVPLSA